MERCRQVSYPRIKRERACVPVNFADSMIGYDDPEYVIGTQQDGFLYDEQGQWFPGVPFGTVEYFFNPYPLFPIEDVVGATHTDMVSNFVIKRKADYAWLELRLKFDFLRGIRLPVNRQLNANYRIIIFHWTPQVIIFNGQRPPDVITPKDWFPEDLFSSFPDNTAHKRNILTQVNPTYKDACTILYDEYFKFSADFEDADSPPHLQSAVNLTSNNYKEASVYVPPPPGALGWSTTQTAAANISGTINTIQFIPKVQLIGDFGVHTRRIDLTGLSTSSLREARDEPGTSAFNLFQQGGLFMFRIKDIEHSFMRFSMSSRVAFTDQE